MGELPSIDALVDVDLTTLDRHELVAFYVELTNSMGRVRRAYERMAAEARQRGLDVPDV
jgi:hypothetical protein